ncbi:butyrophilin subfamily 2 member A2-like [Porphyrio hochstetteri]
MALGPVLGSWCLALSLPAHPLHPGILRAGKAQGHVPGRLGSSGGPVRGWNLCPAQSCWGQALGCDQVSSLLVAWRKFLLPHTPDVVTLDPNMAHPKLVLSEDGRSVRWGREAQDLPDTPQRFTYRPCVLGQEGFREGRHCWEVEVKGEVAGASWWALGVARHSVNRKGHMHMSSKEGIWGAEYWERKFQSLTSPRTPLSLSRVPSRVWVCLDCPRGLVTFIDGHSGAEIFTFPPASFNAETIRPWFGVGTEGTELCLRGSTSCSPSTSSTSPQSPCPSADPARAPLPTATGADVPLSPIPAHPAQAEQDRTQ